MNIKYFQRGELRDFGSHDAGWYIVDDDDNPDPHDPNGPYDSEDQAWQVVSDIQTVDEIADHHASQF